MNERIRNIEALAWEQVQRTDGLVRTDDLLQKFAELLIDECVNVCKVQPNPMNLNYKPSERIAEAIKQHFGKF